MAQPGRVSPATAKFSFWSSMAELVRLVMRSKAPGLKTRLAVALGHGAAGQVDRASIAPVLIGQAIDAVTRQGHAPRRCSPSSPAWPSAGCCCSFISNATPLIRDSIFTPVSQQALARSAQETFAHSLSLSLNFHQGKHTGARGADHRPRRPLDRHPAPQRGVQPRARRCSSWRWRPIVMTSHYDWRLSGVDHRHHRHLHGRHLQHLQLAHPPSPGAERGRQRGGGPGGRRPDELRDHQDLRRRGRASSPLRARPWATTPRPR